MVVCTIDEWSEGFAVGVELVLLIPTHSYSFGFGVEIGRSNRL